MTVALTNGHIFTGWEWLTNHAVVVENDIIVNICPLEDLPTHIRKPVDLQGQRLIPGLIDTQVNGGGGVLFNDAPSLDTLKTMGKAHRQFGTTGFYPTLISDDLSVMERAIAAVKQALDEKIPGVLGIHLEGPFLNSERKGVHDSNKFRRLDDSVFQLLAPLLPGKVLLTLAPELTSPEMIGRLAQAGVRVAAGHSAANYEQTKKALAAGIMSFTHLFNAMSPLTSREPGMVGAALEDKESWCGIIADGFHVHPTTLKIAHRAKAAGKMILVTDAMPTVGANEKAFTLNGELIRSVNGKLSTAQGTLAGSDLNMLSALTNCIQMVGIDMEEAIRMASLYPANMMEETKLGTIAVGQYANMILIDDNFQLLRSWINGAEL